jgi:glycosyltransferase involved in cell wall biosynthesis
VPRIGYVPYSRDLSHPADRRRFCFYARKRGLPFNIADVRENYDVVVVAENADTSVWSRYPKSKGRVVYELIDSYLAIPERGVKNLLRGLARFATGQSRRLQFRHGKALEQMCSRSDAVICSTPEQRERIREHCANVHVILDIHSAIVRRHKVDYRTGEVINLVWEGFAENLAGFDEIKGVLRELGRGRGLALHLITDLTSFRYMRRFVRRDTAAIARKIWPRVYLYQWNEQTCSQIIAACDLSLIPVSLDDALACGKPANKLLLFWRLGMPSVVSATPAYEGAMREAGLAMACRTAEDWRRVLQVYLDEEEARREAGVRGREVAERLYGEGVMIERWDKVFESVLA